MSLRDQLTISWQGPLFTGGMTLVAAVALHLDG